MTLRGRRTSIDAPRRVLGRVVAGVVAAGLGVSMVVGATPPLVTATPSLLGVGANASEPSVRAEPPAHRIDLAFVGDIHTLRRVNYSAQRPGGGWDFTPMFSEVAPLLRSADTAVCHMEAPIAPPGLSRHRRPAVAVHRGTHGGRAGRCRLRPVLDGGQPHHGSWRRRHRCNARRVRPRAGSASRAPPGRLPRPARRRRSTTSTASPSRTCPTRGPSAASRSRHPSRGGRTRCRQRA